MATSFHVGGPALVSYGAMGTSGALTLLGMSEDGIDIALNEMLSPVRSDAAGEAPADLQRMGVDATIRGNFSVYDLSALQAIRRAGGVTEGLNVAPGRLVGSNADAFRLVIASASEPWRFYCCVLRGGSQVRTGTKYSVWSLNFYAWVFVSGTATTAASLPLYDHTAA